MNQSPYIKEFTEELRVIVNRMEAALQVIALGRNEFSGPSLDYMQGYRDGQEYLQRIARAALGHGQDDSSEKEATK